jgi:lysophospholipase L1-like esterase
MANDTLRPLGPLSARVSRDGQTTGIVDSNGNEVKFTSETPSYLGQVATRCMVPNIRHASNQAGSMETSHIIRETVSRMKVVLPNFQVATTSSSPSGTGQENTAGGIANYRLGFKHPDGTLVQALFSRSRDGYAPDGGMLVSDWILVPTLRDGDQFNLRIWVWNAGGRIVYTSAPSINLGSVFNDKFIVSTAQLPDQTMVDTFDNTGGVSGGSTVGLYPCAILGDTTKRSFFLLGDSRVAATGDTVDRSGDVGELARSIGPRRAYINAATPSDRATWWATYASNRLQLAAYCSDAIIQLGINDVTNGRTAGNLETDITTIAAMLKTQKPTQRVWGQTIAPKTTSSDSWATTANQTLDANNTARTTVNDWLRTTAIANIGGVIDVADQVETYRNSGLWAVNGQANYYTADGLHASQNGYLKVLTSGIVRTTLGI